MPSFTVQRVRGLDVPPDVAALFEAAEQRDFQAGLGWYRNLASRAIDAEDAVSVYVLRRDDRPVAALPAMLRRKGRHVELRALSNFYTSLYLPALSDDVEVADLAELVGFIRRSRPGVTSITIAPMDQHGREYQLLMRGMRMAGLIAFEYFCFGNWYLPVSTSAAAYLGDRPGELRSTLRRMARRFESQGGRVEILHTPDQVEQAFGVFESVYASSWKPEEPYPEFVPGLMRHCAQRGWLRVGVAWLAGKPIAAQFWVVANGCASIYKLAYDRDHARLSPGTLLTAHLMTHVIDIDAVRTVDYLTGDDEYKRSWMSERRERWGLVAYDPSTASGVWAALQEKAKRLIKRAVGRC